MKTTIKSYQFDPEHRIGLLCANICGWSLVAAVAVGAITGVQFVAAFLAVTILGNIMKRTALIESERYER